MAPYIVTLWNGREPADAPDDVLELMRQRHRAQQQSNILVFVLDSQGKYVHSFDGMTDYHPSPIHDIKKRMPAYFIQELNKAARAMGTVPAVKKKESEPFLPTVEGQGIRIYVTLGQNRLYHFLVPTVEAVSISEDEKRVLRYREATHKLEAQALKRWLAQMYPPAVMDGHGGMEKVSGTLAYSPAGENSTHRFATLRGNVQFVLDNKTSITYQGPIDLVLKYSKTSNELESVLGRLTSKIPRVDQQGHAVEYVPMTVAIESISTAKNSPAR